jgi:PTS system galactitol-specific IIA component
MNSEDEAVDDGLTISEENILVGTDAKSCEEVIQKLGALLYKNGFVRDTFTQAVLDREKVFPTGLQTHTFGFAIPHTDTEHVIKTSLAIATLHEPVLFRAMDNPEINIPVTIVMMLAVRDPKKVIPILRSAISIVEDGDALLALAQASSTLEIKEVVHHHIECFASKV